MSVRRDSQLGALVDVGISLVVAEVLGTPVKPPLELNDRHVDARIYWRLCRLHFSAVMGMPSLCSVILFPNAAWAAWSPARRVARYLFS